MAEATLTAEQQTGKADSSVLKDREFELRTAQTDPSGTGPGSPRAKARSPPLSMHLAEDRLSRQLPLTGQGTVKLPVMLHAAQVQHSICFLHCMLLDL